MANIRNELAALDAKRKLLNGNKVIFFCDMDGVLAKWDQACNAETIYEKDYFYNLQLEPSVKDALMLLHEAGFNVGILSAAAVDGYARGDKTRWREKYGMECLPCVYSALGQSKVDAIEVNPDTTYILLDDYNPNLVAWDACQKAGAQFVAVKFLNGINGGSDLWQGRTIYHRSSGVAIANSLADIAVMAALTKNA